MLAKIFKPTVGSLFGKQEQETAAEAGKRAVRINMNSGSYKLVTCSSHSNKTP